MKRFKLIASALIAVAMLAACANQPTATSSATATAQVNKLQQVAATQCPIINGELSTLTSLQGLPANTQTALAAAAAANQTVCKDISSVNAASLQTLVDSVLPIILDAVKSAGLAAADQNNMVIAVGAVRTVIQVVIAEQQINAPAPATTAAICTGACMTAPIVPTSTIAPAAAK